ncbi:hypothetical protein [Amycolatopsis sp. cmx-4-68]
MSTATKPPAVVTGASSGIGLERVLPDEANAKQQGKLSEPGSADA